MYLEFTDVADFVAHLSEQGVQQIWADITVTTGRSTGEFQIAGVAYHAAITAKIGDDVAVTSELLGRTTSMHLSVDQERTTLREAVFARFAEVEERLRQQGFDVRKGVWRLDAPFFLRG